MSNYPPPPGPQGYGQPPPPQAKKSKLWLYLLGGCLGLIVLGALVVGGIFYFAYSTLANSEAAKTAAAYLSTNEKVKAEFGDNLSFTIVAGSINVNGANGTAVLGFVVTGSKGTGSSTVDLTLVNNVWQVKSAAIKTPAQQDIKL